MSEPVIHEGPGHAEILLSLSGDLPDDGMWHQGWTVCECGLDSLRAKLGPPHYESLAGAETVRRTAESVLHDPDRTHLW